jgi:hypothetical protein
MRVVATGVVTAGFLLAAVTSLLDAQTQPPRPKCDSPEHRRFDFWVGDWNVTIQGQLVGTNLVTLEEDGCVVHEHWRGSGGDTGQSLNFYDRGDGKWHQVWVSNSGGVLNLSGAYTDGTIVFEGESIGKGGGKLVNRLTFFKNADSTVRQFWQISTDGGKTWGSSFDGLYRKK